MPDTTTPGGDVVARYATAWSCGDLMAAAACYHPDFTLRWFGRHALAGEHVGKAAALSALADFAFRTHRQRPAIIATLESNDRGMIIAQERLEHASRPLEVERVLVFELRDGLLWRCAVYDQDQALMDQVIGLA